MPNSLLMFVALLILVAPSLVGHMISYEDASALYFIRDKAVTIILTYFIYRGLTWNRKLTKLFTLLILVVSIYYLINFIVVAELDAGVFYNYVIE